MNVVKGTVMMTDMIDVVIRVLTVVICLWVLNVIYGPALGLLIGGL